LFLKNKQTWAVAEAEAGCFNWQQKMAEWWLSLYEACETKKTLVG